MKSTLALIKSDPHLQILKLCKQRSENIKYPDRDQELGCTHYLEFWNIFPISSHFHSLSVGCEHHWPKGHMRPWIRGCWRWVHGTCGLQPILGRAPISEAETRQEEGVDCTADQNDKSVVRKLLKHTYALWTGNLMLITNEEILVSYNYRLFHLNEYCSFLFWKLLYIVIYFYHNPRDTISEKYILNHFFSISLNLGEVGLYWEGRDREERKRTGCRDCRDEICIFLCPFWMVDVPSSKLMWDLLQNIVVEWHLLHLLVTQIAFP